MSASRAATEFSSGIVTWRRQRLLAAGFPATLSATLAADPAVDLHELLALVDRGCAPTTAVRILAPTDGWTRWSF